MKIRVKENGKFTSKNIEIEELTAGDLLSLSEKSTPEMVLGMIAACVTCDGSLLFDSSDDAGARLSGKSLNSLSEAVHSVNGLDAEEGNG